MAKLCLGLSLQILCIGRSIGNYLLDLIVRLLLGNIRPSEWICSNKLVFSTTNRLKKEVSPSTHGEMEH